MAKDLTVLIKGDPRNPSGPSINYTCMNARSFFHDTTTFYGEDDSGEPVALRVHVTGWRWMSKSGSWWEIEGFTEDKRPYKAEFEIEAKVGEIRYKASKVFHKEQFAEA